MFYCPLFVINSPNLVWESHLPGPPTAITDLVSDNLTRFFKNPMSDFSAESQRIHNDGTFQTEANRQPVPVPRSPLWFTIQQPPAGQIWSVITPPFV